MSIMNDIVYMPSVRTSKYNLGALKELDLDIKSQIIPRIIVRGDNSTDLDSFLTDWSGMPIFLEISKYALDLDCDLNINLNDYENHFSKKFEFFREKHKISNKLIPVINENSPDKLRNIVQLGIKTLNSFDYAGIVLDISTHFDKSFSILNSLLAAFSDEAISRTILIIDAGKIDNISQINIDNLTEAFNVVKNYNFYSIITSSTSYPATRPSTGETATHTCIDPIWQNRFNKQLDKVGKKIIYGDYAATDPSGEVIEFDFAVQPIPYATYLLNDSFEWFTLREGKGGEYEKFRLIAKKIREHNGYHHDDFCYSTKQIKNIAEHKRKKAGNQAYWNKLKINQHISAIVKLSSDGHLGAIGLTHSEEADDED